MTLEEQIKELLLPLLGAVEFTEADTKDLAVELAALVRAREQKAFDTGVWSGKELQKNNDEF